MQIRRAEIKDIDIINKLLYQVNLIHHNGRPDIFNVGKKYRDCELIEMLKDDNKPIFVAVDTDDVVIGYAFCVMKNNGGSPMLTDIKTLYIDDLCVDEDRRGEGVGKMLLNFTFEYAKEKGCYNVTLNAWRVNKNAFDFYAANGMEPMKVCMEKILN